MSNSVWAVRTAQLQVQSGLYEWAAHMDDTDFEDFDATAFTNAFGSEMSAAGKTGNGLFGIVAKTATEKGNQKVPAKLKTVLQATSDNFRNAAREEAKALCDRLRADESPLAARLKESLADFNVRPAPSAIRVEAGMAFGHAIRNHLRSDNEKATKRMLRQAMAEALSAAKLQLSEKVSRQYAI